MGLFFFFGTNYFKDNSEPCVQVLLGLLLSLTGHEYNHKPLCFQTGI